MYRLILVPKKCVVRNRPTWPYHSGRPTIEGCPVKAPRGCLSKPMAMATSASPCRIAAAAICSDVPPVAHPLKTPRTGMPVNPSELMMASGLDTTWLPTYACCTRDHSVPASASASRAASAPIWMACLSPCRPKG